MSEYSRRKYAKERKHYIRSIQKSLPLHIKYKKYLMKKLKQSILDYEETHTHCTIEELYQEFGTVEEICESTVQEMPAEQLIKNMTRKRRIIGILITVLILAFVFIVYREIQAYLFSPAKIEIYIDDPHL